MVIGVDRDRHRHSWTNPAFSQDLHVFGGDGGATVSMSMNTTTVQKIEVGQIRVPAVHGVHPGLPQPGSPTVDANLYRVR